MRRFIFCITTVLLAFSYQARADVLVTYDFEDSGDRLGGTTIAGVSATDFTLGAWQVPDGTAVSKPFTYANTNDDNISIRPNVDPAATPSQFPSDFAAAQAADYSYTFTVSADTGTLDITDFDIRGFVGSGGMNEFALQLSTDGGSNYETMLSDTAMPNKTTTKFAIAGNVADASVYQGISALTVRLYHYDDDGNGNSGTRAGFADIQVNGTVIPEPGTLVMMMLGLGTLLLFRRRKC